MTRVRVGFLIVSVIVVLLFASLLVASRVGDDEDLFRALGNLAEVVHLVQTEYVDELNQEALALSLDAGIIESVDPGGAVLGADQVDAYARLLEKAPAFGLLVGSRIGSAAVRHTLPGSPAADAALEIWEVIEEIDGVNTRGRPLWQIRLELDSKETAGTPVTLTVVDQQVDERREVVLEAKPWTPIGVSEETADGFRVVRVEGLPPGSAERFEQAVAAPGPVIVDLRDLLWGLESEWLAIADLYLEEGALGRWQGRKAGETAPQASPGALPAEDLMVLVGPNTEGIGETLAVALGEAGATLVGATTAGHAPHMRMVAAGEVHLYMPVGLWLRSDETPINGNGVEPDEVVEADVDADDDTDEADPVLDRAIEILHSRLDRAA